MTREEAKTIINRFNQRCKYGMPLIGKLEGDNELVDQYTEAKKWKDYYDYLDVKDIWKDVNKEPVPNGRHFYTILAYCEKYKRDIKDKRERWKSFGGYVAGHYGSNKLEGIFLGDNGYFYKAQYWMILPDICPILNMREGYIDLENFKNKE